MIDLEEGVREIFIDAQDRLIALYNRRAIKRVFYQWQQERMRDEFRQARNQARRKTCELRCKFCGGPVKLRRKGPVPSFCTNSHRAMHYKKCKVT